MTVPVQRLDRTLSAYRIGDPNGRYPIFDDVGSTIAPGRWNTPTSPVIYAGEHYSTAMLEKLVHANGLMPPNQHFIEIAIPIGVSYEVVTKDRLPGWDSPEPAASRAFGAEWIHQRRSAVLLVPSFVARIEQNILINKAHEDAGVITYGLATPIWWDSRLFVPG